MARLLVSCFFVFGIAVSVCAESSFAGSSVTSDSSGTRSVLVSGRNGVVQTRFGNGNSGVSVGSSSGSGGTYASSGGGVGAFAGPAGAYAGPGGAYAGTGSFGFPYGGGSYASSSAGDGYYPQYPYDPYAYGGGFGNGAGVYSSSDSNGIQTRFANVGPGGQATIVEQNGDEPPRVYTYRGSRSNSQNNNHN